MKGLVHIYCGDGKGKTTCALGLGLRACGNGMNVFMLQFLKSNHSSEHNAIRQLINFRYTTVMDSVKFVFQMTDAEKQALKEANEAKFAEIRKECEAGKIDLLILDEAVGCVNVGLLDEAELIRFLKEKPEGLEVVLTGRDPSKALMDAADYISEIRKIKHPFDRGIEARKGIEF